jgi:diaminobutyrate-2-oxoglutarate transaminase
MFYGLVFNKDQSQAKQVAEHAFSKGLVFELSGSRDEVLKLMPALTIDDTTLVRGLDIIEKSIKMLV